jgi:hypothetical protein
MWIRLRVSVMRARRRTLNQPGLDLAVAIRADEHALLGFLTESSERLTAHDAHPKRLLSRMNVMGMKVHGAFLVATNRAAPSRLCDQDALELLEATCNGFANAPLANPSTSSVAARVEGELGGPVVLTDARLDWTFSSRGRRPSALPQ